MARGAASGVEFDLLETFWRKHADRRTGPPRAQGIDASPLGNCPELRCLAGRLPPETLAAAADRARSIGVGADRVLVTSGAITDDAYVRALAEWLDVTFDPLAWTQREQCPLDDGRLIDAVATGIVPLRVGGNLIYVIAPSGIGARRLTELTAQDPQWRQRIRLTTTARLKRFVEKHGADAIGARATNLLQSFMPRMSAAPSRRPTFRWKAAVIAAIPVAVVLVFEPRVSMGIVEALLAVMFIAWIVLRLVGAFMRVPGWQRKARIPDDALPVYTIMVALYREAASVDGLVAAIRGLDYPGIMAQTPQDK